MARSYFSYSVVRSDPTNLTTGGDSILTTLKNVNWEVKKLDSSNNEVSTSIYTGITGATTVAGAAGVTDWNGLIEFWADAGQYVIKITDPSSRIANKNIYWDSVSGQTGGIPGSTITSETITTTQIKDAEVKTADIDSSAVETAKIADAAITTAKIAPSGVTTDRIDNAAITTAKIAPSGVTTDRIDNSAITSAKIASGAVAQSNQADGTYVPIGAIMQFAGTSAPTNWLLCDGSEKAVASYPGLDSVLGTIYGARTNGSGGAGSSHFRLPDLRGRVVAGKDDMGGTAQNRITSSISGITGTTLGSAGGDQRTEGHTHTFSGNTGSESRDHTHSGSSVYPFFNVSVSNGSGYLATNGATDSRSFSTGGASQSHTHSFNGTTSDHDKNRGTSANIQPTIILNFIIRAV